jgi:hypothetical protein
MELSEEDNERFRSLAISHPLLPAVMVEIHDRLTQGRFVEEFAKYSPGSPDRMIVTLRALDIRASAFLKLVDTVERQELFITLLKELMKTAWLEFAAFPIEKANIDSLDMRRHWRTITDRTAYWEAEGFRRLVPSEAAATVVVPKKIAKRQEPNPALLENKETVNHKQAALALGISERTLDRWIADGRLIPIGPTTRKRFKCKDLLKILSQKHSDN